MSDSIEWQYFWFCNICSGYYIRIDFILWQLATYLNIGSVLWPGTVYFVNRNFKKVKSHYNNSCFFCILIWVVKLQNIVEENGLLKPRKSLPKRSIVTGPLYQNIEETVQKRISEKGDWLLIENGLTGQKMLASEVMSLSQRWENIKFFPFKPILVLKTAF